MAASSIRAGIEKANDYYRIKLPATIASTEVLDAYLTPVDSPSPTIEPIYRMNDNGEVQEIAQGFFVLETATSEVDGETLSWTELCIVIHDFPPIGVRDFY